MSSKKKTKVTNDPAAFAKPSITGALSALDAGNANAQATYAQYRPDQDAAIQQAANNIRNPSAFVTDAQNQLDKTINGDYINSNPYTSSIADLIAQKTQGNYNTTFGASGRSHGGLAALLSQQGVGDALQSFYSNNYETERQRQQQAIGMAPSFHQDQYTDANALYSGINNTAMGPLSAAAAYGNGVNNVAGNYGTQTTVQKQGFGLQQAIGLATMVGGAVTGNPMMISGGASMASGGGGGSTPGWVSNPSSGSSGMSGLIGGGGTNYGDFSGMPLGQTMSGGGSLLSPYKFLG